MKNITILFPLILGLASCSLNPGAKRQLLSEIDQHWEFRQVGEDVWLPATVPGSVHTDLLANKVIEDPYYRLNEKKLQWIDKVDWEYRTIFKVDNSDLKREKAELVFEGLDTYAKVFLNGDVVLQADNMFRTWVVDVSGRLKQGDNELLIQFESPAKKGLEALKAYGFQLAADNDQSENGEIGPDRVSPYVRKAPYHFGWDWGPRLVTSGIWRQVKLRAWSTGRITDVNIIMENLTGEKAELTAEVEIEVTEPGDYTLAIHQYQDEKSQRNSVSPLRTSVKLNKGTNLLRIPIFINHPMLWQPNGYGERNLYSFRLDLLKGHDLIDDREAKTGLRNARLVQDTDSDGKGQSFYFEVNGKPVFAKGANYIPNDVFLNQVSPEKYEFIVRSAVEANMNMLRVWGGGIYENDLFYDLCDKYGIMVWQDFMFACAMYPGNDAFLENVRLEAIDNVKRLRNHPCIVLWCGNNEIEAAWGPYEENRGWGWKQRYTEEQREIIWHAYDTLFHKILPEVIMQEDPGRPYWHSSPSAGMGRLASYETASGDMHYWGVWHGLHPFTDFRKYKSRFMSEYGFQSFPELYSVKKYTLPEDWNIESDVMTAHQRSGIGNLRIKQYMAADYKIPENFEQFLYVGQLMQAEAIKLAIESHRAEMAYCMGSLYWQINDCWPVASWSGIDYYGRWKALHYFVREAFKPTVLVCSEDDGMVRVEMVSDSEEKRNLILEIRLLDFNGGILWQSDYSIGTPSPEIHIPLPEIIGTTDPAIVVLVSALKKEDQIIDTDLHYFVKPKDLKLTDPQIKTEIKDRGEVVEISIISTNLAKNVFLYADGLEEQFSDNFFDVLPGDTVLVTLPKNEITPDQLRSLKNLHLYLLSNSPQNHENTKFH
jgi:beta-mannosidase